MDQRVRRGDRRRMRPHRLRQQAQVTQRDRVHGNADDDVEVRLAAFQDAPGRRRAGQGDLLPEGEAQAGQCVQRQAGRDTPAQRGGIELLDGDGRGASGGHDQQENRHGRRSNSRRDDGKAAGDGKPRALLARRGRADPDQDRDKQRDRQVVGNEVRYDQDAVEQPEEGQQRRTHFVSGRKQQKMRTPRKGVCAQSARQFSRLVDQTQWEKYNNRITDCATRCAISPHASESQVALLDTPGAARLE